MAACSLLLSSSHHHGLAAQHEQHRHHAAASIARPIPCQHHHCPQQHHGGSSSVSPPAAAAGSFQPTTNAAASPPQHQHHSTSRLAAWSNPCSPTTLTASSSSSSSSSNFHAAGFRLGERLGAGTFGTVRRALHVPTGKQHAVKILPKATATGKQQQQEAAIAREVASWRAVQGCTYVARLEGVFEDEEHVFLVQELCEGGTLRDALARSAGGSLSERTAAAVTRGVLDLLVECHARSIVYGDCKPGNIVFCGRGAEASLPLDGGSAGAAAVRAVDFGSAHVRAHGAAASAAGAAPLGSPLYLAPEVLEQRYGVAADVWSAGVMLYQMLTGRACFWPSKTLDQVAHLPGYEVLSAVRNSEVGFPPALWQDVSPLARDLVARMLDRNPATRITAAQALAHPWLAAQLGVMPQPSGAGSCSPAAAPEQPQQQPSNNVLPLRGSPVRPLPIIRSGSSNSSSNAGAAPGPLSPQRCSALLRSALSSELAGDALRRAPSM